MNKDFVRDTLILSPGPNQSVSVVVFDKKLKISPVTEQDGKTRFNIKIKLKANLQMIKFKTSKEEIEKEIRTDNQTNIFIEHTIIHISEYGCI